MQAPFQATAFGETKVNLGPRLFESGVCRPPVSAAVTIAGSSRRPSDGFPSTPHFAYFHRIAYRISSCIIFSTLSCKLSTALSNSVFPISALASQGADSMRPSGKTCRISVAESGQ